ncbi:LuxR family transcriptional regulator [Ideonella sp. DXS29W]|uniref:LuxR family transcriptional regulator n=1 Tax=Ideonella lacteola TaxID=2984193 RepID=A0ABU9BM75_9BURK
MWETNTRDCHTIGRLAATSRGPLALEASIASDRVLADRPPEEASAWCLRPRLLQALTTAGSDRRRGDLVRQEIEALGFDEVGFGALDISRGSPVVRSFCGDYADPEWIDRYFARRYHEIDPRLRAIERSSLPCVWTLQELARQPVTLAHKTELCALVDDLHERGVTGGLMLALPALPGQTRRFVSLLTRRQPLPRIDDLVVARVLLLALCLEEFHHTLPGMAAAPGDDEAPMSELSPMQAQILDLLSRGMGDKQIAARLDISRHNVDYHLRRLRKRFGARNRVQLMQAALRVDGLD